MLFRSVQVANPFNGPVRMSDFEIRVNPDSGAPQRFFFGVPDTNFAGGKRSGNIYGADVELGPCTVEEPRTAIVFSIPDKFPNGDAFPRDQWLDYLDLRQPVTTATSSLSKPGDYFPADSKALFAPAWGSDTVRDGKIGRAHV